MAKESGLGLTVAVDDSGGSAQTISNDIRQLSWNMPSGVQDVTGVNSSGKTRKTVLIQFRDPEDLPADNQHISHAQGMMLRGRNPRIDNVPYGLAKR